MGNNKVREFLNDNFGEVRTTIIEDKIWFLANDCLEILEYSESGWRTKIKRLHSKGVTKCNVPTKGGEQQQNFIDEPNLYRLVFGSKMKRAEEFQDWITNEVIPTLRKDGMYVNGEEDVQSVEELNDLVSEAMERKVLRKYGIGVRKDLTKTINDKWTIKNKFQMATYTNELVYKPIFNATAKELKGKYKVKQLRDELFTENELVKISDIEKEVALLIDFGQEYYTIKEYINKKYKAS